MVPAGTFQAAIPSSDDARVLGSLVENLARQWISDTKACDDVNVVFGTLRDIVARAISNVANEWNHGHDGLRVLPPEVQEQCFASLSVSDRCRLALVCSHWCSNVVVLPGIWPRLELKNWRPKVDALLARSGQLPLDLSVDDGGDLMAWDGSLRSHATRLRKLELHHVGNDISVALGFPAPRLEELSIATGSDNRLDIPPVIFDQHAPRLRTLRLTGLSVPVECPAFGSITTLTLQHTRGPLNQLFVLMPRLKVLNLRGLGYATDLPALPRQFSLRVLRLSNVFVTVKKLVQLGYSKLDALHVATTTLNTAQFLDALTCWPTLATSIRVRADWNFETILRPDRRQLHFFVCPVHYGVFQKLFQHRAVAFHQIQRLVLPWTFRERSHTPPCPPLVEQNRIIGLPALRTLVLACGAIRPAEDAYPLRECILGNFKVPQLARIEVLKAAEAPRDARLEPVEVVDLMALLETALVCDDRGALEVFVDTANGVSLRGDVDQLRKSVRRLLI